MGFVKEFREFAFKGNMIDLAVGIIIGGAFGGLVTSLVNDILMPPLGKLIGGIDFKAMYVNLSSLAGESKAYATMEEAKKAGDALSFGLFINTFINFLIVAFAVFLLVKLINTARKRFEKEAAAAPAPAPAEPPADVKLLTEIRDLLARR